jgi:hypothetical protein
MKLGIAKNIQAGSNVIITDKEWIIAGCYNVIDRDENRLILVLAAFATEGKQYTFELTHDDRGVMIDGNTYVKGAIKLWN